jgi:hypothetical protein
MSRKKKRDDLASEPKPTKDSPSVDPGRQPRVLGWLVLITGAFSTWYWYRPLPPAATETANSTLPTRWPTSQSGPKSVWTHDRLDIPNLADFAEEESDLLLKPSAAQSSEPKLVGTPNVSLVPWDEPAQDIHAVLKSEVIPLVPIEPPIGSSSNPTLSPPTWTPGQQEEADSKASKKRRNEWPDVGYNPEPSRELPKQKRASRVATQIPALLETGMRSIRTSEEGEVSRPHPTETPGPHPSQPSRQPQFIRQPTK